VISPQIIENKRRFMAYDPLESYEIEQAPPQGMDNSVDLPPGNPRGVEMHTLTIPKAFLPVTEPRPTTKS
jgi:hypothetical protein